MKRKSSLFGYVLLLIVGLGIGFVVGGNLKKEKNVFLTSNKSQEELLGDLSDIMMPKDEYNKIVGAIIQAGMGMLSAQAEPAKITINQGVETQLRARVENKYSRKYFTEMNAKSMSELSKEDLEAILAFYHTPSGEKFLRLSPSVVENTMKSAQIDLSSWLPQEVEKMVGELKNGIKPPETKN